MEIKIKAWCIVRENKIPENDDDPKFLCVFKTREQASLACLWKEKVRRCSIIIK